MQPDYEFLKNLENILQTGEETLDFTEIDDIMATKNGLRKIVEEAATFLEERDEFWTNVK